MRRSNSTLITAIAAVLALSLMASPATAACGDGIVDAGETCDDSNTVGGDGCSDTCQFEGCPYDGSWTALINQTQFIGHGAEDVGGNIVGVVFGSGTPEIPSPVTGTRSGASLTLFDHRASLTSVGTMVSCDEVHFSIVELSGFAYVSHRVRSTYCGDGIIQSSDGETCDDGNFVNGDACQVDCQEPIPPVCGNGAVEIGEECDDGNTDANDGCSSTCQTEECGNGLVEGTEQCDDGNAVQGDGCSNACEVNTCGNSTVEPGEICDDGNAVSGDGCSTLCQFEGCPYTGTWTTTIFSTVYVGASIEDGTGNITSASYVAGDPRTAQAGTGSRSGATVTLTYSGQSFTHVGTMVSCDLIEFRIVELGNFRYDAIRVPSATYCGDGVVQSDDGEICDDGNFSNADSCLVSCTPSGCGDGFVGPGETCDDGNLDNGDGCTSACQVQICGNGFTESGEACDDGNAIDGDGCSRTCEVNVCGNATIEPGEGCDDGNTTGSDGCSTICQFEGCSMTGSWQTVLSGTTYLGHVREGAGGALSGTSYVAGSPASVTPVATGTRSGPEVTVQYAGQALTHVGTMETCDLVHYRIAGTSITYDAVRVRGTYCGDNIVQAADGEACDDGNFVNGDACSVACTAASGCGNGILDAGETCDDGNANPNDACVPGCVPNVCGDGILESGVERCDDGNTASGDGCVADCSALETETASGNVGAFFLTVSTDPAGTGATPGDPVETSVTAPAGTTAGSVSIVEAPAPPDAPPGFAIMGTAIQIEATGITPAPTAAAPMRVVFAIDASQIVAGQDETTIVIHKNGTAIGNCTGASIIATPDPCVARRERLADGDVRITVNTTTFSTWSSLGSVCGAAPALGCKAALPGKSALTLTENGAKDVLRWTWKGLDEVPAGLFGSPTTDGDQTICVYDADGAQLAATAPAGGTCGKNPCWKSLPNGKGFRYASKDRTPQGIGALLLGAGAAGKAKIVASAGGSALTAPAGPLTLPVVVQLRSAQGGCFEARFGTASSNAGGKFKAKSD